MYRPKASTLKAKQLKKLEQKENLKATIQFVERNINIYYKIAVRQFFKKDNPILIT